MQFGEVEKVSNMFSQAPSIDEHADQPQADGIVSFHAELPVPLKEAMASFIEKHPNWDQYRLIQAALAGFLVQNGIESREITRLYVGKMFRSENFA